SALARARRGEAGGAGGARRGLLARLRRARSAEVRRSGVSPALAARERGAGGGGPALIHPLLAAAFAGLDQAGVSWALLRGEDDLERPRGDVDLLVTQCYLAQTALEHAGFRRLRAWGHGTHRFFLGYDGSDGTWVSLDVVTEL